MLLVARRKADPSLLHPSDELPHLPSHPSKQGLAGDPDAADVGHQQKRPSPGTPAALRMTLTKEVGYRNYPTLANIGRTWGTVMGGSQLV
jgi:hypothetical protein